jgi:hypothetical protein
VSRISQHLKEESFNVTQSAVSSNYIKTDSTAVPESNNELLQDLKKFLKA